MLSWDTILNNNFTGGGEEDKQIKNLNSQDSDSEIKKKVIKTIEGGLKSECSFAKKEEKETSCIPGEKLEEFEKKALEIIRASNKNGGNKTDKTLNSNNSNNSNKINSQIVEYFNCGGTETEKCVLKNLRDDKKFNKYFDPAQIDDLIKRFFKPEGPKETFNFLSNHNIDEVLSQYFHRYNDDENKFHNIGFQLRDFAKYNTNLQTFDFYKEITENNYKTFAVVINTDETTGPGIHWFCLFIDARHPERIDIEYFNSSGRPPLSEIETFLEKTRSELNNQFDGKRKIDVKYNQGIQLQEDGHSCGVWSLAYIWLRLEGVPQKWFNPSNIDDSIMHLLRKYFFTNDNKAKRTYGGKKIDARFL